MMHLMIKQAEKNMAYIYDIIYKAIWQFEVDLVRKGDLSFSLV